MNRITQEAQARQRFLEYFLKNGHATETAIRYRISRKTLYKWLKRYDGTWQSLVEQSRQDRYFKSSDIFCMPEGKVNQKRIRVTAIRPVGLSRFIITM